MGKRRGARGKYETQVKPYLKEVNEKVRQGVTEEAIAKALGISVASLNNYRNQYAEFAEALSKNKGADVLTALLNAGIDAAIGGYKETSETIEEVAEDGSTKTKTVTKSTYYPPNPVLNKFYVCNYGKAQGFTNDPLDYELKKKKQQAEEDERQKKNWDLNLDKY